MISGLQPLTGKQDVPESPELRRVESPDHGPKGRPRAPLTRAGPRRLGAIGTTRHTPNVPSGRNDGNASMWHLAHSPYWRTPVTEYTNAHTLPA